MYLTSQHKLFQFRKSDMDPLEENTANVPTLAQKSRFRSCLQERRRKGAASKQAEENWHIHKQSLQSTDKITGENQIQDSFLNCCLANHNLEDANNDEDTDTLNVPIRSDPTTTIPDITENSGNRRSNRIPGAPTTRKYGGISYK